MESVHVGPSVIPDHVFQAAIDNVEVEQKIDKQPNVETESETTVDLVAPPTENDISNNNPEEDSEAVQIEEKRSEKSKFADLNLNAVSVEKMDVENEPAPNMEHVTDAAHVKDQASLEEAMDIQTEVQKEPVETSPEKKSPEESCPTNKQDTNTFRTEAIVNINSGKNSDIVVVYSDNDGKSGSSLQPENVTESQKESPREAANKTPQKDELNQTPSLGTTSDDVAIVIDSDSGIVTTRTGDDPSLGEVKWPPAKRHSPTDDESPAKHIKLPDTEEFVFGSGTKMSAKITTEGGISSVSVQSTQTNVDKNQSGGQSSTPGDGEIKLSDPVQETGESSQGTSEENQKKNSGQADASKEPDENSSMNVDKNESTDSSIGPQGDARKLVEDASSIPAGQFYRKPSEEEFVQKKNRRSERNKNKQASDVITVQFRVVVSKDFKFSPGRDKVLMRFGESILGGWNGSKWVMECERKIEKQYYLMKCNVNIPKELMEYRALLYKYAVQKGGDDKPQWEHIHRQSSAGIPNRLLKIPITRLKDAKVDVWHQYDALMYPAPSDGLLKKFWKRLTGNEYDKICNETKLAIHAMLPKWEDLDLGKDGLPKHTGETFFRLVESVCYSSKQNFYDQEGHTIDEKKFNELIFGYMHPCTEHLKSAIQCTEETPNQSVDRAARALVLILMIQHFDLNLSLDLTTPLCEALMVKASHEQRVCSDFNGLKTIHFTTTYSDVQKTFINFVRSLVSYKYVEPKWVFLIPMLHFIEGDSVPFEEPSHRVSHDTSDWWGTKGVAKHIDEFQRWIGTDNSGQNQRYNFAIRTYLDQLPHLFHVDFLLPRTLVAILGFQNLKPVIARKLVRPEIILANVLHLWRSHKENYSDYGFCCEILNCVASTVQGMESVTLSDSAEILESAKRGYFLCYLSERLLEIMTSRIMYFRHTDLILAISKVWISAICYLDKVCSLSSALDEPKQVDDILKDTKEKYFNQIVDGISTRTYAWFVRVFTKPLLEVTRNWCYVTINYPGELQFMSDLLSIGWTNTEYGSRYRNIVNAYMQERLAHVQPIHKIAIFCSHSFDGYHKDIEELFSKAAFDALEINLIKSKKMENFYETYNKFESGKAMKMLSRMFLKLWGNTKLDNPDEILKHILSWASFTRYVDIFCGGNTGLLCEDSQQRIVMGLSVFENTLKELVEGNIKVEILEVLLEHQDQVANLHQVIDARSGTTPIPVSDKNNINRTQLLIKLLFVRKVELKRFNDLKVLIGKFFNLCMQIKPAKSDCLEDTRVKLRADFRSLRLHEICLPIDVTIPEYPTEPRITFFQLPVSVELILEPLCELEPSIVFQNLWNAYGRSTLDEDDDNLVLESFVANVWEPAKGEYSQLSNNLKDGAFTFGNVDSIFGKFNNDYKQILHELVFLCGAKDLANNTLEQIKEYHVLDQYQSGANTMLDVKRMFGLKGDFKDVEMLATAGQNKKEYLSKINQDLIKAGRDLAEITSEKRKCIEIFARCKPLVDWLKISVSGPKEVKVLVDLAMISATGQGDMEVQRVSILHAAVTGYAPLIYELTEDTGFKRFLQLCQSVWQALRADRDLPQKLKDTNRHLTWLKNVKDSHGSVEVNALSQAQSINARGIFQVGNLGPGEKNIDNVIQLKLSPESKKSIDSTVEWKTYSVTKLNDLQSKLMLVAGKGEKGRDQVERFVEIYDGITRLANTYVKICAAGSILFQKWKSTFYCEPDRPVCAFIDLGLSENKLQGSTQPGLDVSGHIQKTCQFLEQCLEDWLQYIKVQRTQYYYLNHYTTSQIVILRKELAKIAFTKGNFSPHLYPMLSFVKDDCLESDIREAIHAAFKELEAVEEEMASDEGPDIDVDLPDNALVDEEQQKDKEDVKMREEFIQQLEDSGYPRGLAQKALNEFSADQVEEGIMWCMEHVEDTSDMEDEHQDDEMVVVEEDEDEKIDESIYEPLQMASNLVSVTDELLREVQKDGSLKVQLESLWTNYISKVDSSVSDYLSVEHLGKVLEELAMIGNVAINRTLPSYLQPGKPNLIVCNENEIYQTVLSVYLNQGGDALPLPKRDEVLLCTEETCDEEVELLWHRAMGDRDGKIFCLVSADLLNYDVSQKAEQSLDKLILERKKGVDENDYRLFVVCGREKEDKAHIITALDKHRVAHPIVHQIQEIRQYLFNKFIVPFPNTGLKPGSSIDPQNLSVRLIKSHRAGVGKSHRVMRMKEAMEAMNQSNRLTDRSPVCVTFPLQRKTVDISSVLNFLIEFNRDPNSKTARVFHFDIGHDVQERVDYLLFNLLILGSISDSSGHVWKRSHMDIYLIETMPLQTTTTVSKEQGKFECNFVHSILGLLPSSTCWSPMDSLQILNDDQIDVLKKYTGAHIDHDHDQFMDIQEFHSQTYQRPYQYLAKFDRKEGFGDVDGSRVEGDMRDCLEILIKYCGLRDPSWAELRHFVNFLNTQLMACETSVYCEPWLAEDFPGFKLFVVRFMIQMSRDFATRSLNMTEETPGVIKPDDEEVDDREIVPYMLKKRWETSPHPYVFFNYDGQTMTFLGFNVDRRTGDIQDPLTNRVLEQGVMPRALQDGLIRNMVALNENFDALERQNKIMKMCYVMGIEYPHDPDSTYELTTDNVKKILAIYMRFRCGIPVVIMGETGCGKTRLIKFMCDLQKPPGSDMKNMVLMKVHGGTTENDIKRKVRKAGTLAVKNKAECHTVDTVLFFDEANTTEAIGLIKEIMCDGTMGGLPLKELKGLKLVAACNPYRKHSEEMIRHLEQAGLGYHVQAEDTHDKLGRIPMRRLVYRVQPLPRSMLPLVWDFGQLSTDIEELYIRQMVLRHIGQTAAHDKLPDLPNLSQTISSILAASQQFMRDQKDECSFVSLRDVERVMSVMLWFYQHRVYLFELIDDRADEFFEEKHVDVEYESPTDVTRALILAIGVCYHACLENRDEYRRHVSGFFQAPCALREGHKTLHQEIVWCQDVFLDNIQLGPNIARNQALKENVFMMVVCIELRIPLFLVGKPGSSKSLAKTIIADSMQGDAAHSDLFKYFKQVHMVSFQCSPLSTPDGIVGMFHQCARLQEGKDLTKFVSVVVLDEVGLAEDSPRMPLKTLHPLLEDGCEGDEEPMPHKKVAFIGISNWALDPAKMNRGILVQRGVPDEEELEHSAWGICATDPVVQHRIKTLIKPMSEAYLELYNSALEIREFFGLRDFYSLVKMVYGFSKRSGLSPTWYELQHAIMRNFGGLDQVRPVEVFDRKIQGLDKHAAQKDTDPDCTATSLIKAGLHGDGLDSESRYLLILTENYAALALLEQHLLKMADTITIFGSSFPKDQEYTQVCRNINRIKVCMEAGKTVVLLNLENLYESLYDALNQYYVYLGGERFVDLGLGTQRVKCRVHKDFRLIVVAEKNVVYKEFPIPLINRLEKHFLAMSTILSPEQLRVVDKLEKWADKFASVQQPLAIHSRKKKLTKGDVFIGYNADTAASIVLQICQENNFGTLVWHEDTDDQIVESAKSTLLQCCTPDAIIRLKNTVLKDEEAKLHKMYFDEQKHNCLLEFLQHEINIHKSDEGVFAQVTTHSRLLSVENAKDLARWLKISQKQVYPVSLQAFDTEQQFFKILKKFFDTETNKKDRLLLLQCDSGDKNGNLIACARHNIWDVYLENMDQINAHKIKTHIVFIIQLPRVAGGCFLGFEGGRWISYHIDELMPSKCNIPDISELKETSVSRLFESVVQSPGIPLEETEPIELDQLMENTDASMEEVPMDTQNNRENYHDIWSQALSNPASDEDDNMDTEDESVPVKVRRNLADLNITETGMPDFTEDILAPEIHKRQFVADILHQGREAMENDKNRLDVDHLINDCLHTASAMLKDKDELSSRKTYRVQLLMKILNIQKGEKGLIDVLKRRVYDLLKDKEETAMTAAIATSWLSKEVASADAINKAGTFRRALWQYLESKVAPMLAGLLAFADTNSNLDIIEKALDSKQVDIVKLWLDLLDSTEGCVIKYKDLQSATQRSELTEFLVRTTGCDGSYFAAVCPFSWIIKSNIDQLIYQAHLTKELEDEEELVIRLFSEMPVGRCLEGVDIVDRYLHDYVRMMYKAQSTEKEAEYRLVSNAVVSAAREVHTKNSETTEFTLTIPGLHLAYLDIQKRVMIFSQVARIWPESVIVLDEFCRDPQKTDHPLMHGNEMTLDVMALTFILEHLAATKDTLDNSQNREDWMERVETFKPVIERLSATFESREVQLGTRCQEKTKECKPLWTRICVVQMFIKHVCPPGLGEDKLSVKKIMPLYNMLREGSDFKKEKSLKTVESFLKLCNQMASAHFFGEKMACPSCKEAMSDPVQLLCKHIVCESCVYERIALDDLDCPVCKEKFPKNFRPVPMKEKQDAIDGHSAYKQRCNAFFMDLVSTQCFHGDVPPEHAVIKRLLDYVTCQAADKRPEKAIPKTKQMSVFSDRSSIDPTPVVRSFLLQQLLRSNIEDVHEYMQNYFERAGKLMNKQADTVELALLCINCLEDYYHCEAAKKDTRDVLVYITEVLLDSTEKYKGETLNIEKLEAIAGTRFALTLLSRILYERCVDQKQNNLHVLEFRNLMRAAEKLCDRDDFKWPRLYLMRLLSRRYGMEFLKRIGETYTWTIPPEARDDPDGVIPDVYVMYGAPYVTVRDAIAEVLLGKDMDDLSARIKALKGAGNEKETCVLLALHRELGAYHLAVEKHGRTNDKGLQEIINLITNLKWITHKNIAQGLAANNLGKSCPFFNISSTLNPYIISIVDLAICFQTIMMNTKETKLTGPLLAIFNDSGSVQRAFLPTMPQDDTHDIREVLLSTRQATGENPTMYQCPNGHPYVIGNCGRPVAVGKCLVCGQQIGGTDYHISQGNTVRTNDADITKPGHILGNSQQRPKTNTSERDYLTPASCTLMRLMLHLSMLIGSNWSIQEICAMIQPPIQPAEVPTFLLEHIISDLEQLMVILQKSREDVILCAHLCIKHIISAKCNVTRNADTTWKTRKSRATWEQAFATEYIQPVLQGLDKKLLDHNQKIVKDERLANNQLLKVLYEIDYDKGDDINLSVIEIAPGFWRFQPRITISHLKQELDETASGPKSGNKKKKNNKIDKNQLLKLFLKMDEQLQLLRYLPDIVKLHQHLYQRYNRTIDGSEATNLKIDDMLESIDNKNQRQEIAEQLQSFTLAWEFVRYNLDTFALRGVRVPDQYCAMSVDGKTSLAILLPSWKGLGFCSLAVIHYLVTIHNSFMDDYSKLSRHVPADPVDIQDVTHVQLVAYHPERDLVPIILANCNYTLTVGQEMDIEYDFNGMERQIEERYIRGRPRLNPNVDLVTFREDYTNASVFAKLRVKIPQEALHVNVQRQLQAEQRHLPELCESLACLDTCIGFLVSVGGHSEMKLIDFMLEKLHMKEGTMSPKAAQCKLKYVEALWLHMSHTRAQMLAKYGQDPFDGVQEKYLEPLPEETIDPLAKTLENIDREIFLQQLFEGITLQLTIKRDENDEDYVDNAAYPLGYVLHEFIESRDGQQINALNDGERFPTSLAVKHCISVWRLACRI